MITAYDHHHDEQLESGVTVGRGTAAGLGGQEAGPKWRWSEKESPILRSGRTGVGPLQHGYGSYCAVCATQLSTHMISDCDMMC